MTNNSNAKKISKKKILPDTLKWWTMFAVGMSVFMSTLDMGIINISLPTLVEELETTFSTIQWVTLGYVIIITGLMLIVARFGDIFPKNKLFAAGLVMFTFCSLLCGISPNVEWLITFRILQGMGGVMTQALGPAILVEVFPKQERGRAMGIIGSVVSVGIALGPAIGGIIIGGIGWRWIFLVNVPIGIITFFILLRYMPSKSPSETNQSFDIPGAFIMLVMLACFALGMTKGQDLGFDAWIVQALLSVAGMGLILFIFTEQKMKQPMIELGLFRNKVFSLSLLMSYLVFIAIGGFFLLPFFLQIVKNYPTQQVGFMMMVVPLLMGIFSPISGWLSDRFGTRGISFIGLVIIFFGCFSISTINMDISVIGYLLRVAPLGLGIGIFASPNNSAIMGSVPPHRLGVASGLMALMRNLGQTTGVPFMGAIFTSTALASSNIPYLKNVIDAPAQALVNGINSAYRTAAIIILLATIIAILVFWKEKRGKLVKKG